MTEHFHELFMDEEKIKVIFCVGYKQPLKRLNLRKYFRQFERLNFNIHQNELSVNCHQYAYLIDKNDLKLAKLVKDICYQDFAY
ncbi:DUF3885 domain-containing protein [Macrococcus animalis]|uniref:DUF3885 domain-containing protein n=1 Tax=Macrococcus animalis TaxID=3395467 RepID=UPI0039BEA1DA